MKDLKITQLCILEKIIIDLEEAKTDPDDSECLKYYEELSDCILELKNEIARRVEIAKLDL